MVGATRRLLVNVALLVLLTAAVLILNIDQVPADPVSWVVTALVAAAVGVVAIDLFWWVNLRLGTPLAPLQAAGESAVIGALFGAAQISVAAILGLTLSMGPALTMAVVTVSTSVFGVLAILIGQARRDEDDRLERLISERVTLAEARVETASIMRDMHVVLASDIDLALSPARVTIEARLTDQERLLSPDDWSEVAAELRVTARSTVRPLSRRLWAYPDPRTPRRRWGQILRTIVTEQPFQPMVLILIYWATALGGAVSTLGWWGGLVAIAIGTLMVAVVLGGANALMRRAPQHHASIFIAATVLLQVTGLLTFAVRYAWSTVPYTWAEYVLSCIGGVILILVTSGFGSLRTYRENLARTLRSDIDDDFMTATVASGRIAQLARESSRILHGSVQTRLVACAVAIERASLTRDVEAFRQAMQEAHAALAVPVFGEDDPRTLGEQVEHVVSLWRGLCSVQLVLDSVVADARGELARDVCRAVEEALNNAITHGEAEKITVDVRGHDDVITIEVVDDGFGPSGNAPGLGSALFDSLCGEWSLSGDKRGSIFRGRIYTTMRPAGH